MLIHSDSRPTVRGDMDAVVRTRVAVLVVLLIGVVAAATAVWNRTVSDGDSSLPPDSPIGQDERGAPNTPPHLAAHPSDGVPQPPARDPDAAAADLSPLLAALLRERPASWRANLGWLRASLAKFPGGTRGALDWYAAASAAASDEHRELVDELLTSHFARDLKTPAERADGAGSLVAWMVDDAPADTRILSKGLHWLSVIPHGPSEADARRLERRIIAVARNSMPKSILLLVRAARAGLATAETVQAMFGVLRDQSDAEIRSDALYWGDAETIELLARNAALLDSDALDRLQTFNESPFTLVALIRYAYASSPDVPRAVEILRRLPGDARALSDADWSRGFVHIVRGGKEAAVPYVPELLDRLRETRDSIATVFDDGLRVLSMTELRERIVAGQVAWSVGKGKLVAR